MRTFSFDLSKEDHHVYQPGKLLIGEDLRLYQHAAEVFPRLLSSDRLPFSHGPDDRQSLSDRRFARCLTDLAHVHGQLELAGFNPAASLTTSILYEYHPHIEVLLEFLLRQEGHTIFGAKTGSPAFRSLQRCRGIASEGLRRSDSIFFLSECAIRVLKPLNKLCLIDTGRSLGKKEIESRRDVCRLMHELKAFFCSPEVKAYLVLREKTYSNVFDKTVEYGTSIVERYRRCFMVMTELRFVGEDWDDAAIRGCADRVGGLFKELVPIVKEKGILGYAWRLDTIRDLPMPSSWPINVWRVRWLTFVQQCPTGPAMTGEEIAASLLSEAETLLNGISPSPSFSSAVIKGMTALSSEPPPASDSAEGAKGYQKLIEDWVFELSMVEIYRRIRVMEGNRPMMCGRGHPSDGRAKKVKAQQAVA